MTKNTSTPADKDSSKKTKAAMREQRLREALRQNLHKRKAQSRVRKDTPKNDSP